MDSTRLIQYLLHQENYTEKQKGLIEQFKTILAANGIEYRVNQVPEGLFQGKTVIIDVEHNESGEFVGCGLLESGSSCVYYFTDILLLHSLPFHTFFIVAHNGVTDIELLQQWGVKVEQEQLVWDTMLIAHILDSSRKGFGLKKLAKEDLGIEYPSYDDIVGKRTEKQSKERITLDKQPIELITMYNSMDCITTERLYVKQCSKLF